MTTRKLLCMVAFTAIAAVCFGENVPLDPPGASGDLTVIESVAPLGLALTYVSGGNGLIGLANVWPTMTDTPSNRAFAANAYDHTWMQYLCTVGTEIRWSSPVPLSSVFAIPGVDHGPSPGENLEFLISGSSDGGTTWEIGSITAIYRDGFDTAGTTVGLSDDYSSLWSFVGSHTLFRATPGDLVEGFSSPCEGEIDALAAPQRCGDGVQDAGEECDDGVNNSDTTPDACRTDCSLPICGDGVIDTGEECDVVGASLMGGGGSPPVCVNCRLLDEPLPAVSEWGLIVMALLGLTVGTILYGRYRVLRA